MLESIIKDHIMQHLASNSLLNDHQYGFHPGRSCELLLRRVLIDWTHNKTPVDILYLEYQKAFDKVPHQRLISKLQAYGIDDNVLLWIYNFLRNRTQRVCVRGTYSNVSPIISSVPQGSVLGPILFIVYINDLSDHIQSSLWTFADDTKIYHPILSDVDHTMLQNDFNYFMQWNKTWQGSLNNPKCKYLSLGSSDGSPSGGSYTLTVDSDNIEIQECIVKNEI